MKKILLLIAPLFIYSLNILAQQGENKYDSLWKKVEDLSNKKGLTKSALTEVDKIYRKAKKEKKDAQVIKALLYKMSLNETFDELHSASIDSLEKEKQMIIDTYWAGLNGSMNNYSEAKVVGNEIINIKNGGGAEQYYNKTYETIFK